MACIVTVPYIIQQTVTKHVNPGVFLRTKNQVTATFFFFAFLSFSGLFPLLSNFTQGEQAYCL